MFDWLFGTITRTDDWYGRDYETSRWDIFMDWLPYIAILAVFAIVLVLVLLKAGGIL